MNMNRRNFLRSITYSSIGLGIMRGIYEIDNYDITFHTITNSKIKNPFRLIHLTDMHFDSGNQTKISQLYNLVNLLTPDMIVMTGDYIKLEDDAKFIDKEINSFNSFITKLICDKIYACTGNWDIGYELDLFKHNKAKNLDEKIIETQINENEIIISGLSYGENLSHELIKKINDTHFNLGLIHSPDGVNDTENNLNLILSGHTHGGQIRFPIYGALYVPCINGKKYEAGLYELNQNQILYVNRGIGESIIPIRINCKPEIAVFDIETSQK